VDNHIYAVVTGNPQRIFDILHTKVVRSDALPTGVAGSPFAAAPRGGIWLPRNDGLLLHYQSGSFDSTGQSLKTSNVLGLADDQRGTVWGAALRGVVLWSSGHSRLLTTQNGLPCNSTYSLIFDHVGTLWVSAQCGFMALPRAQLERWVAQPEAQIAVRTYDVLDGAETGGSPFGPAATKSQDGRLWFVNGVSLQVVDPTRLSENHLAPPVVIESVQADTAELSPRAGLRLPEKTKDLRIDYTALSFASPQKVLFRYKLEGRDSNWQEAGTRRQAFYTDLPPGSYRFHVIACNNDGVWNETGAQLAFTIPPAFTQSIWFKMICLIAFIGLVYSAYRFRVRQVTLQLRGRMYERLAERERIARDLHDTFFQGIQGLLLRFHTATSQLSKEEPARRIFEETLKQSDQVMLEGRELVLDLRATASEQNDLPTAFSDFGEGMRRGSSCDFKVVVNGAIRSLHPVVFEELFKIGKEALGNAFRHSNAHLIEAELNYEPNELRIRIRDDGTGIDSTILRQGHRDGHFGLPGMRERAQKVGAHLDVWSKSGAGTEVELRIAARIAYLSEPSGSIWKLPKLWHRAKQEGGPHENGDASR
jgi:signal transduction histidine kinase